MGMSHGRVIELQSQSELLERIQLLTDFSSNLITVYGSAGSGKTWLVQRYLEAWAEEKNQSLLMCYPNQGDEQHRSMILRQLDSKFEFDPYQPLLENLLARYQDESCNLVIAVDDADLLSETLMTELWMTVLETQRQPKWSINVVLFALPNEVMKVLMTRLGHGQEHKPVDLEIEPLTEEDSDRLFEFIVVPYLDEKMERRVRQVYRQIPKLPGEILALSELRMEKRIVIRSIITSPSKAIALIMVVGLFLGGGYWWMLSDQASIPTVADLTKHIDNQTAIPSLPEGKETTVQSSKNQRPLASVTDDTPAATPNAAQPDAMLEDTHKPKLEIMSRPIELNSEESPGQKRVVISSDVVDALLDQTPQKVDTSQLEAVAEDVAPHAQQDVNPDVQPQEPPSRPLDVATPSKAQPSVSTEPKSSASSPEPIAQANQSLPFVLATASLKAMSPRSYTLQLAAFNSPQEVVAFVNQYRLQDQVNIYQTTRDDRQWFIVTYSNYPTIQLARDAVVTLPASIQSLGPWAKSLRQIHREIEQSK